MASTDPDWLVKNVEAVERAIADFSAAAKSGVNEETAGFALREVIQAFVHEAAERGLQQALAQ